MRPLVLSDTAVIFPDSFEKEGKESLPPRIGTFYSTSIITLHTRRQQRQPNSELGLFLPPPSNGKEGKKKRREAALQDTKNEHINYYPSLSPLIFCYGSYAIRKGKGEKKWFKTNNVFRGPRNKIRTWLTEWVLFAGTGQWGPCADGRGIRLLAAKGTRSRRHIQSPAQGESPRLIQGQENTKC